MPSSACKKINLTHPPARSTTPPRRARTGGTPRRPDGRAQADARNPLSSRFFFNDRATTEIYTLSLHDALPISTCPSSSPSALAGRHPSTPPRPTPAAASRSEEHTSELPSHDHLVCRLLLDKNGRGAGQRRPRSSLLEHGRRREQARRC